MRLHPGPWWALLPCCPDGRPVGTCPGKALAATEAAGQGRPRGILHPGLGRSR